MVQKFAERGLGLWDTEMSRILAEIEGSLERLEGERALLASLRPALLVRAVVEPTKLILYSFFIFFPFISISWRLIILQYCSGFCHTLT